MIEFSNVSKVFPDGTTAVDNISFQVNEGELFVIIGPSGCGKTTTMKMINRLIDSTKGTIRIQNKDIMETNIHKLRWNIGYVLQQIALFPHMTIKENIAIVPELKNWSKQDIGKRVDELLEMAGLEPDTYRNRKPSELSGGQQQRVGVVRALAGNPDIILMDEPFSALDPISREQLQKDIARLQKEIKKTIVFVTHDMDEALALGHRICVMKNGSIVQIDEPANLLQNPENDFVKEFLGNRHNPWAAPVSDVLDTDGGSTMDGFLNTSESAAAGLAADTTVREAVERLKKSEDSKLPVYENNDYKGHISYKDIIIYLEEHEAGVKGGPAV